MYMSIVTYTVKGVTYTEAEYAKLIREKYIKDPPLGVTSKEIKEMSDDALLDMDYFLNE